MDVVFLRQMSQHWHKWSLMCPRVLKNLHRVPIVSAVRYLFARQPCLLGICADVIRVIHLSNPNPSLRGLSVLSYMSSLAFRGIQATIGGRSILQSLSTKETIMKTFDGVPILDAEGYCPSCRQWFPLRGHNLPKHTCGDTKRSCKFAGSSASEVRYVIKSEEERTEVAAFLLSHRESDPCLINPRTHRHSIECHAGALCRKTMMRIRNAYIEYVERPLH